MSTAIGTGSTSGLSRAPGWQWAAPALLAALAAYAVPFWGAGAALVDLWLNNGSYGHGMLIVPVALYLLWLQRDKILGESPQPFVPALALVCALMAAWLVFRIIGILMAEQLVLMGILLTVPLALLGRSAAVQIAPITLYLFCAIPVWSYLTPWLQVNTATASAAIVRMFGVPIFLDGLYLTIPDGQFVVADVCSGLRYLLAALSLGGFYALLNLDSWWGRSALVVAAFLMGIAFNWVRVVGIVLAGHYSQMQSFLVHSHIEYGWVLFLFAVAGVLVAGRMLERAEAWWFVSRSAPGSRGAPAPARGHDSVSRRTFWFMASAMGGIALLSAGLVAHVLRDPARVVHVDLGSGWEGSGWSVEPGVGGHWRPVYAGADGAQLIRFRRGDVMVDLYVAFYASQREGSEALNEANAAFDNTEWARFSVTAERSEILFRDDVPMEEFLIHEVGNTRDRRLVWRTAWVNGTYLVDPVQAKIEQLRALLGGRRAAAAVVVSTSISGEEDRARAVLREFLDAGFPLIERSLARLAAVPDP